MDEQAIFWFGVICGIALLIQRLANRSEVADSPQPPGVVPSSSPESGEVKDQVIEILSRTAIQDLRGVPLDTELESLMRPPEIANTIEEIEDHFAIRLPGSLRARDSTVQDVIDAIKERGV